MATKPKDYTVQASIGIAVVVFLAIGINISVSNHRASQKAIVATKPIPAPIPEVTPEPIPELEPTESSESSEPTPTEDFEPSTPEPEPTPEVTPEPTPTSSSSESPASIPIFILVIGFMIYSICESLSTLSKLEPEKAATSPQTGQPRHSIKPVKMLSHREYLYQLCYGDRQLADGLAASVGYEKAVAQLIRDRGGR